MLHYRQFARSLKDIEKIKIGIKYMGIEISPIFKQPFRTIHLGWSIRRNQIDITWSDMVFFIITGEITFAIARLIKSRMTAVFRGASTNRYSFLHWHISLSDTLFLRNCRRIPEVEEEGAFEGLVLAVVEKSDLGAVHLLAVVE